MPEPGPLFSENGGELMIPVEAGQAVDAGWTAATGQRPLAVTWHWTATADLAACDRLLGGADAARKGIASAHYAVGRSFAEGVHRYVALDNRSWHAGKEQTLRWDGGAYAGADDKGARTAIGVETVNLGYARPGLPAGPDWTRADSPDGRWAMRIQPWTEAQVAMMIAVGREIVARWPHLGPRDHHGHSDLCPGYKVDVAGFPFARVLRGIYDDPGVADVWTPFWTVPGRRRALAALGYLSASASGRWEDRDGAALRRFQGDHGLVADGMWTTFVGRKAFELLAHRFPWT
jgi:N-acetyl-anhydromuramyl-L-alanine amidase AmpD